MAAYALGAPRSRLSLRRRVLAWVLIVAVPIGVAVSAMLILASLQSHERHARSARLLVSHIHEDAVLQHTLVSHALVMGYLTSDLTAEFGKLRADASGHLGEFGPLGGNAQAGSIRAAWEPFEAVQVRALKGLPAGPSAMRMSVSGTAGMPARPPRAGMSMTGAAGMPANTPGTGMAGSPASGPPTIDASYTRVMTAVATADRVFADRANAASRNSYLGSVGAVSVEALILALLFGGLSAARRRWADAAHRAVAASEARFRSVVQNSSDVIAVVRPDSTIEYVAPSVGAVIGHRPDDLLGTTYLDLVHQADRAVVAAFLTEAVGRPGGARSVEYRLARADGSWAQVESLAGRRDDAGLTGLVLTTRDVTRRKTLEDQLVHQAFHDALTGLPNRALFTDRLAHALLRRNDQASALAVLFLDLDDFKTVNDSLGHGCGDQVLAVVAGRLDSVMREADTAARFGGDEFAVLLETVVDVGAAEEVARRLVETLAAPVRVGDTEVSPHASVGIALGMPGVSTAEDLLRNSDVAMYAAKSLRKGGVMVYAPDMLDAARARLQLKADLEHALTAEQFTVHYQPTVTLRDRSVTGFEALVRWQHPERNLVPPLEFIPLAEETGLILALGAWVLRRACVQAAAWQREFPCHPARTMSVNISAVQLQHPDLVTQVRAALRESGLDPAQLILEITESVLLADPVATSARLQALKALGVRLAIDDFGTGYSSLSQLRNLPVDILKIDKAFVDNVATVASDTALATAIIEMGEALDLELIAEGIETEAQANVLQRLRCGLGQGFMFARPLDAAHAQAFLAGESATGLLPA